MEKVLTTPVAFMASGGTVDLAEFWQTRPDLWLSDDFKLLLTYANLDLVTVGNMTMSYSDIMVDTTVEVIEHEAPEGYIFEKIEDLLAHLALEITAQAGGTEGRLLGGYKCNYYFLRAGRLVFKIFAQWSLRWGLWDVWGQVLNETCRSTSEFDMLKQRKKMYNGHRLFHAVAPQS